MTVIATIITAHCTAHATDSYITQVRSDGSREVLEDQQTKIVRVDKWRGAMAYWGLARHGSDWSTLDWLRKRAKESHQYPTAEEFARDLGALLSTELAKRGFQKPTDRGIGIHFTAYEQVEGYWVPELFQIRNWVDPSYSSVRTGDLMVTRETYATLKNLAQREEGDRDDKRRLAVHAALHTEGRMLVYNNGDPVLFNPIATAVLGSFQQLAIRSQLRDPTDSHTHLSLVRRPVEVVSRLQVDLVKPGYRLVGGKPHDLAITSDGRFTSTTGD